MEASSIYNLIYIKKKNYNPHAFKHCGMVNDCKLDAFDSKILVTETS